MSGTEANDRTRRAAIPTIVALVAVLVVGLLVGRASSSGSPVSAQEADTAATATRTAELAELSAMQTRVAEECAPEATPEAPTPSPTATPASMGAALVYDENWTLTVTSLSPVLPPDEPTPVGQFVRLSVTVANSGATGIPPLTDLRLVDNSGTAHTVDVTASNALVGENWTAPVKGGQTEERALIYDVPLGSGNTFTLTSKRHPDFQVTVIIEARG
jgi:hypothetical protein